MAKKKTTKTTKLDNLKVIGEELYNILLPEDEDTGEDMEFDAFLLNGNKKLNEKNLTASLIEFCEALEDSDEEEVTDSILAFMKDNDIDIPWDEEEPEDDDEDDEEEPEDDDDDDDDIEVPDFGSMSNKELKAFAKENKIKGIAGLNKKDLIKLIEMNWISPEEEPEDEDDEPDDGVDYDELSTKEIKALAKKAGFGKLIKGKKRDEIIDMLEASDEASDEEEDEPEDEELTLEETLNETSKLVDLKALVGEYSEFKKLRKKLKNFAGLSGPRELKPLMYKALGIDAPAKAKKKPKVKKEKSYTRFESVVDTIKEIGDDGFTLIELRTQSNDLYVEKANITTEVKLSSFTNMPSNVLAGLVAFGVLELDKGTYTLS